jgi:hypothetical protein
MERVACLPHCPPTTLSNFLKGANQMNRKWMKVFIALLILVLYIELYAGDLIRFDGSTTTAWIDSSAWKELGSFMTRLLVIVNIGEKFKRNSALLKSWTMKESGTGLKLATFDVSERGAENIKILDYERFYKTGITRWVE